MAADGSLLFDTNLDSSGVMKGLNKLGGIGKTALLGIAGATAATVAGLAAFGISAIKVGSTFSAQMSRVQAISGATTDELKKLNAQAIQLGADTSFSALQAAAGMENLASAGFDTAQIMSAMPGLLDLAAVSGGDVANAAEIAASALNAFGLEATEAGHVANVFARAAADTNAEALDMGEAMKYVAPVAKAMGLSLEETAASIGIMSDAGIKGSQAGTALRGALSRLAKPTKTMKDTMKELGLSFYDAEGNMLPMADTIAMLQEKTAGLTQEQKNNALVTLFGQESLSGMLALIEAGPEKLEALTGSLIESDGAAADMAKTMKDNLKGSLDELMGSLETFQIVLFQSGETPLKQLADKGTEYLNRLTDAFAGNGKLIGNIEALGVSAEDLGFTVEESAGGFEKLAEAAMGIVDEILNSFIDGLPQMMEAIGSMMSGIGETILSRLPDLITMGIEIIMNLITGLVAALPMMLDAGFKSITALIDGILKNLPALIEMAMTMMQTYFDALMEYLPMIIKGGMEILLGLVDGIVKMLPELITMAIDLIILIADNLIDNIDMIIDAGIEIIFALIDGIIENLPKLIEQVPRIINKFADAVYRQLPKLLMAGIKLLVEIGKGMINAIPTLIANIPQIIMAIINVFTLANMWNVGKGLIDGVKAGIKASGDSVMKYAGDVAQKALKGLVNAFSGAGSIGANLVQGVWYGISNAKGWILSKIAGFGAAIIGGLKSIFGIHSPSTVMRDEIGEMLPPGIGIGIDNAMPDLKKDMNAEMEALTAEMQATVAAETGDVAVKMTSGTVSGVRKDIGLREETAAQTSSTIEVVSVLDGRKVSKGTAEYTSNEFAKTKRRKK